MIEEDYSEVFIDLANRVVNLCGAIVPETINEIIHNIWIMDHENNDPIDIIINSIGGVPEQALALASTIRNLDSPVNTHATGECMSAAPWILAAGTSKRTASKTCIFMTHFGQWDVGSLGKEQLQAWFSYRDIMTDLWFSSIAEWTGTDVGTWHELNKDKDFYFTADEAKHYGLIDEVLE